MRELDEVLVRSDHGTGAAILSMLQTKAAKYLDPDLAVRSDREEGDSVALRTWAAELVTILVRMAEPSARITVTAGARG